MSGPDRAGSSAWLLAVAAAAVSLALVSALSLLVPPAAASPVQPGAYYSVRACFPTTPTSVTLRLAFYDSSGDLLVSNVSPGIPDGPECYRSGPLYAPCAAASASYGASSDPPTAPTSLALVLESGPAGSCATPTPVPSPSPSPAPSPMPPPPSPPPPASGGGGGRSVPPPPAPTAPSEPAAFPYLVNGGFEEGRADGTPYGWNKFGGTLGRTSDRRSQGGYAAFLESASSSTKWAYQTVQVEGGGFYQFSAYALKDDPAVAAVWLRVSWYASDDGSGTAIGQHDSDVELTDDMPQFRPLTTGPVQAPSGARSARVRLMLRPRSEARAVAFFDDVSFGPVPPPVATPSPGGGPAVARPPDATPPSPPGRTPTTTAPAPAPTAPRSGAGEGPPRSRATPTPGDAGPAVADLDAPSPVQRDGTTVPPLANIREEAPTDTSQAVPGRSSGPSPALLAVGAALGALGLAGVAALVWPGRR
ncbi:MAG TPA: hypothetical protein VNL95_02400 [Dehalococcoidia bacterium]|nr:hypothetical protein [Dehalococcoidia bacterium]